MGVYNPHNNNQLEAAVNSILNQTFTDYEFIIYDDGSNEETRDLIKGMESIDSRIRVIRCSVNHGLAFSLNQCIDVAKGKYLARMDADDISLPMRLEKEYYFLENHPQYDWVGCNAIIFNSHQIIGKRRMAAEPNQYNFLPFSPYIHPTVMFRRELFEQGNKYCISEETLRCEDYELFMRLYQQGYKGYNLQEALYLYREGPESYQRRSLKSRWSEMKIRRINFRKMNLPFEKQWIYMLRPLITMFIPCQFIIQYKKHRMMKLEQGEKNEFGEYKIMLSKTIQKEKNTEC